MDKVTAAPLPAAKVRFRLVTAGKNGGDLNNMAELAAAETVETLGNHFLETRERIRQKNLEIAATRAGNALARPTAIKAVI